MKCGEFLERIFDRDPETDRHAAECAACAERRRTIEAEGRLIAKANRVPPMPNLWLKIEAGIRARRRAWPAWVAAAAAGVLVALSVFLFTGAPPVKSKPKLNLVVVEASPETARTFSGMVPSYDDTDPNAALLSTLVGPQKNNK